jgi:synaptic vesicle membrane protein VAT-1
MFLQAFSETPFEYVGAANVAASGENRSLLTAFKTWYKCFTTNSLSILSDNKSIAGYHLGYLLQDVEKNKHLAADTLNELFRLYNEGAIKPQIDSIYPFSKTGEAMQRMHTRQNIGKILLRPDVDTPANEKATESEQTTD